MLVTLKEVLKDAEQKQVAIGSFNTPNLESIMAVIGAAEELDVPVILMHAQVHEEIMPLDVIGPVMLEKAEKARVPVCVHLDHGESIDYIARAFRLGFTSAMYDGSLLPFDENVANTCKVVEMAKEYHASVEAEIGTLGKREGGGPDSEDSVQIYTDPEDAQRFVEATGIDALACSFGTAHGLYLKKPQLDMSVLDGAESTASAGHARGIRRQRRGLSGRDRKRRAQDQLLHLYGKGRRPSGQRKNPAIGWTACFFP